MSKFFEHSLLKMITFYRIKLTIKSFLQFLLYLQALGGSSSMFVARLFIHHNWENYVFCLTDFSCNFSVNRESSLKTNKKHLKTLKNLRVDRQNECGQSHTRLHQTSGRAERHRHEDPADGPGDGEFSSSQSSSACSFVRHSKLEPAILISRKASSASPTASQRLLTWKCSSSICWRTTTARK